MAVKKYELAISDQRMLELIDRLKAAGRIRFTQEFLNVAGLPKQSLRDVKMGSRGFTVVHITNVCREYGIDANWVLDLPGGKEPRFSLELKPAKGLRAV